jgi:hypothetical protein
LQAVDEAAMMALLPASSQGGGASISASLEPLARNAAVRMALLARVVARTNVAALSKGAWDVLAVPEFLDPAHCKVHFFVYGPSLSAPTSPAEGANEGPDDGSNDGSKDLFAGSERRIGGQGDVLAGVFASFLLWGSRDAGRTDSPAIRAQRTALQDAAAALLDSGDSGPVAMEAFCSNSLTAGYDPMVGGGSIDDLYAQCVLNEGIPPEWNAESTLPVALASTCSAACLIVKHAARHAYYDKRWGVTTTDIISRLGDSLLRLQHGDTYGP